MRARTLAALLLVTALGCERADKDDPTPTPPPPDAVVATVSTASLAKAVGGIRDYAEAIRPGTGLFVREELIAASLAREAGAVSLEGLDLAGPVHLILLDGPTRTVVVGKAADRAALEKGRGGAHLSVRDGWALVGPKDAVELVAPWAVPGLVGARTASAPGSIEATAWIDRLMTRHAAAITEMRQAVVSQMSAADPQNGAVMAEYMTAIFNLAGDSARLTATFLIDGDSADLDLALVPKPGSALAGFIAAQKPTDFAAVETLPAAAPTAMVMAGRLALGPYRKAALAMFTKMMNVGEDQLFERVFTQLADLATGDFAAGFSVTPGGVTMIEVIPVSDASAAEKAIREVVVATATGTPVSSMGIRLTHTGHPDLARHGGAVIHGVTTTVDLDSAPPLQRDLLARMYGDGGQKMHLAFPPGALIASIGELTLCEQAIDARTGQAARLRLAPSLASFVQAARARRDSILFVMDLVALLRTFRAATLPGAAPPAAGLAAPGVALSLGFADRSAHLHITLLAETLRATAALAAP
jgi:hypothetical protein